MSVYKKNKNIFKRNLTLFSLCELREKKNRRFAVHCHVCGYELGADRVRDHCHLTGKHRRAAHNDCNLNCSFTGRIPIILHNLRGYDSYLIMQGLGKINCISNNTEKYISLIDSDKV